MSLNFLKFKKNNLGLPRARSGGFTTLELMVVIGIFTIMTGVILANLPGFRDQSAVGLVAQQIALVARQAQVYGNSGRQWQGSNVKGYGLYFNLNTTSSSYSNTSFILFADKDQPVIDQYNAGTGCGSSDTECAEKFSLQGGMKISGVEWCNTSNSCSVPPSSNGPVVSVKFRRAYPDAQFFTGSGAQAKSCFKVKIQSTRDNTLEKEVVIWSTGHIYTKNPSAGC